MSPRDITLGTLVATRGSGYAQNNKSIVYRRNSASSHDQPAPMGDAMNCQGHLSHEWTEPIIESFPFMISAHVRFGATNCSKCVLRTLAPILSTYPMFIHTCSYVYYALRDLALFPNPSRWLVLILCGELVVIDHIICFAM
jgi:hypothetical protein